MNTGEACDCYLPAPHFPSDSRLPCLSQFFFCIFPFISGFYFRSTTSLLAESRFASHLGGTFTTAPGHTLPTHLQCLICFGTCRAYRIARIPQVPPCQLVLPLAATTFLARPSTSNIQRSSEPSHLHTFSFTYFVLHNPPSTA